MVLVRGCGESAESERGIGEVGRDGGTEREREGETDRQTDRDRD